MENTNPEILDSTLETPVEETETTEETTEEASEEAETVESLSEKNKQLFARAKKAEEEAKKLRTSKAESKAETPKGELSTKDVLYFAKADIHADDIDEVREWAKFKGISVSEAHKALTGVLRERAEERKTAQATSTGATRRGTSKVSDETILEKARSKGEMPGTDEELTRLVKARRPGFKS